MPFKAIAAALLVVSIWGINFSFIKVGLEQLPPLLFSALRFCLVAFPALLFLPFPKQVWREVLGVGLLLGVAKFGLLFLAMQHDASAGLSALLLQMQVPFTILLSLVVLKERLSAQQIIGISIALLGFATFTLLTGGNLTSKGLLLITLAALFWACSNLLMKRLQGIPLLSFMVWVCAVPPLPLLLASYWWEGPDSWQVLLELNASSLFALGYVSYLSTLLAFALWGGLLSRYPAASVTPFALLIPIVGMFASNVLLGESLKSSQLAAVLLVLTGLVLCVLPMPPLARALNSRQ